MRYRVSGAVLAPSFHRSRKNTFATEAELVAPHRAATSSRFIVVEDNRIEGQFDRRITRSNSQVSFHQTIEKITFHWHATSKARRHPQSL